MDVSTARKLTARKELALRLGLLTLRAAVRFAAQDAMLAFIAVVTVGMFFIRETKDVDIYAHD